MKKNERKKGEILLKIVVQQKCNVAEGQIFKVYSWG